MEVIAEGNSEVPAENLLEVTMSEDGEYCVEYPKYTEEAVANGYFTGGSDLRMVLLGFRDRLDRGDCGVDVRLNKETDFGLWQDPESDKIYAVMEAADGRQYVIVTVGGAGIGRFPNLRQVHGFWLASPEELDSFTANWTAYGVPAVAGGNVGQPEGAEPGSGYDTEPSDVSGSSSVIQAADGEVLIYNANDKDNIIFLEEEDRALVESVFESALYTEGAAAEGILSYSEI